MDKTCRPEKVAAEKSYPGAAIDAADGDKVSEDAVKERTDVLDNNPHSNGE